MKGILVTFSSEEKFVAAVKRLRLDGVNLEAISPYPIEEVFEKKTRFIRNPLGILGLLGAVAGILTGAGLQLYRNFISDPINSGGRPLFSWPNFIPVTFILGILFAGVTTFLFVWILLKLPEPYHSVFHAPEYNLSKERFYLFFPGEPSVEKVRTLVEALHAETTREVPE